jgi:hypothetical protein
MTNRFNWIDPYPDENTLIPEFCLNSSVINQIRIRTPHSQSDNIPINHFLGKPDYPQDGWEIIKYDLGYTVEGQPTVPVDYPYLVLYNRFTGILRIFIAVSEQQHPFNVAEVILLFIKGPVASTFDLSTAFTSEREGVVSIKDFSDVDIEFRSASRFLNGPGRWLYADFPMMYDPCACGHGSRIGIQLNLISTAEITLAGTATGTASSTLDSSTGTYKDTEGQHTWGWKDIAGFNEKALQKSAKAYKDVDGFSNSLKNAIFRSGLSEKDKTKKVEDVGSLASAAGSLGFLKTGLDALPWISSAITFLDYFVTGGKNGPQTVQIAPMGIELNMRYKGDISSSTYRKDITFFTPGSDNHPISNPAAGQDYPFYNQALGVFHLLEAPELKTSFPYLGSAPTLIVIDEEDPVWSSWDPYLPNDHPMLSLYQGQEVLVDPYNHDAFEEFLDGSPYANYRYKMELPLSYAINPATEFKSGAEILAAFFVEAYQEIEALGDGEDDEGEIVERAAGVGFLLGSNFNLLTEGKGLYRTHWMPLSCLEQMALEFAASFDTQLRISLKVMGNFERGDSYAGEQAQNVLHVWKFAVQQTIAPPLFDDWDSPFINVPIHRFLSGPQVLTNDISAWETIVIGADADLRAPFPASFSIIAGKEIIVSPDAKIAPNITLKIASPNGCTEEYKPATPNFISNFCENKYDLAKRALAPIIVDDEEGTPVASLKPDSLSENMLGSISDRHENLLGFHVEAYPNPLSGYATLRLLLPEEGAVSASLSDLQGRPLRQVLPAGYLPAGEHLFDLPAHDLPPGMYLLTVQTAQGRQSIKLVKR